MVHELFEELDAFNPRWQVVYRTIADAAKAAKVIPMFSDWLTTDEGRRYQEVTRDVPDYEAFNAAERHIRESLLQRLPIGDSHDSD